MAGATLTAESCKELLAKQRYNPDILPQLEAYVKAQAANNTYDIDCNLAVLKLYQFHPDSTDVEVISKVLLLALMRLPSTDYISCMYLVPERVEEMELITSITTLGSLLETCSFRQFWTTLAPQREELIKGVPGFEQAVRDFVCATMRITYQNVPMTHLGESLALEGAPLKALIAKVGWTVEGDMVRVPLNDDNQAKPKKPDEGGLGSDQMTKILASVV